MNSGVYCIYNLLTNDCYIGSSNNLSKRFLTHKEQLRKGIHHSIYLQRSIGKYDINNFIFFVLEFCENTREREQFYLDTWLPVYNMSKSATAPMEGRKHSLETLEKFKNRPKMCGEDNYMYGTKWSDDRREKILSKRRGSKRNDITKQKMSETAKRINSISRVNFDALKKQIIDNNGVVYNSLTEAEEKTGIDISCICDNLKGRSRKARNGLQFRYVGDERPFLTDKEICDMKDRSNLKLNTAIIRQIKLKRKETGWGANKLSKFFNIPSSTIEKVIYNKIWTHVEI